MQSTLKLSKLDAAKRQLEMAIRIYFQNGDPVSIHTLVAAAYNVLHALNKTKGGEPMIVKDRFVEYVKPEHHREFIDRINSAENFFKHADRDPEGVLDFNPQQSEYLLIDAVSQYFKLSGEDLPLFAVFRGWYVANNPHLFDFPPEQQRMLHTNSPSIVELGRARYFEMILPVVMRAHA